MYFILSGEILQSKYVMKIENRIMQVYQEPVKELTALKSLANIVVEADGEV